jgi:hypothetical protein
MERTYYPSMQRVLLYVYVTPAVAWLFGFCTFSLVRFIRGLGVTNFNWIAFISFWLAWVVLHILSDGLRAERLAIKITPTTIEAPLVVGRAEPIPFDKIDYQKTFKPVLFGKIFANKRIYSLAGNQISIREILFSPQQVSEIWAIIKNAQQG